MDYYEILGVSPNASDAVIRVAYRQRLKEVHPDTGLGDDAESSELAQVKRAGEVLLSAERRADYDHELAAGPIMAIDDHDADPGMKSLRIAAGLLGAGLIGIALLVVAPWSRGDETATEIAPVMQAEADPASDAPLDEVLDDVVFPTAAPAPTLVPTAVVVEATVAEEEAAADEQEQAEADEEPATAEPATEEPTEEESSPAEEEETAEEEPAPSEEPAVEDVADEASPAPADLPDLAELPERGAIYRAPTLFLVGPVPSQEIADAFYAKAVAILGAENVVNEYVVHPDAPTDLNGNVRVEQAIQFESASAVIRPEFVPVLGLALEVLLQNPQASLVIEGHTDSIGDADANQSLSVARAAAVTTWLAERGIAPDRLTAVGYGESQPVADNLTEAGRSVNRRIEVQITDLLS